MDFVLAQTYLGDILRIVSDALLGPDIIMLLLFIVYAVFCIGSILVEIVAEHRNFKVHMPEFLAALADSDQDGMAEVIEKSGLLNRQKIALLTVYDYRTLPGDMLVALVKRLLNEEDTHYQRIINRNNIAVRVAPMLGLMGTLIPLGPGIAALGQGDVASLSSSLVIAFNTTVAGLASAAVCLIIARIRRTWYNTYMNALESAMASMLYKIGMLQDAGEISIETPSNHAFLYKQALKRKGGATAPKDSSDTGRAKADDAFERNFDVRSQSQQQTRAQEQLQPQAQVQVRQQAQAQAQSSAAVAQMAESSPFAQFVNYTPTAPSQAGSSQWQATAQQASAQRMASWQQTAQQPATQQSVQPTTQSAWQAQPSQQPVRQSTQYAQQPITQPVQQAQPVQQVQNAQAAQQSAAQQPSVQQPTAQGVQQAQARSFDPSAVASAPATGMSAGASTSGNVPVSSFAPTFAANPAAAFGAAAASQASSQAVQRVQTANDVQAAQRVVNVEQLNATAQGEGGER